VSAASIYPPEIDPDLKAALVRAKLGQGKLKVAAARATIEKKAEEGDPWAIRYLADSYLSGTKNYPQSTVRALKYYEILANRGDRGAMIRIAGIYSDGKTTVKEPAKALQYLKMAASTGDGTSALQVAKIYEGGDGLKKDPAAARHWYVLAALLGNKPARDWLSQHP
jgi:TPR repeat protein